MFSFVPFFTGRVLGVANTASLLAELSKFWVVSAFLAGNLMLGVVVALVVSAVVVAVGGAGKHGKGV